jgi:hypothetical protein
MGNRTCKSVARKRRCSTTEGKNQLDVAVRNDQPAAIGDLEGVALMHIDPGNDVPKSSAG